jgi:hypothetical protein
VEREATIHRVINETAAIRLIPYQFWLKQKEVARIQKPGIIAQAISKRGFLISHLWMEADESFKTNF